MDPSSRTQLLITCLAGTSFETSSTRLSSLWRPPKVFWILLLVFKEAGFVLFCRYAPEMTFKSETRIELVGVGIFPIEVSALFKFVVFATFNRLFLAVYNAARFKFVGLFGGATAALFAFDCFKMLRLSWLPRIKVSFRSGSRFCCKSLLDSSLV